MCGILGQFVWNENLGEYPKIDELLSYLSHRGPDGEGRWRGPGFFLGHRRLAILDLEQGKQPMELSEAGLAVSFNGEIYNFVELRSELEQMGCAFRTRSDTEVLLHGYRTWKENLPSRLIGMFAFAIADTKNQTLFLARDRFGEKPLYVRETSGAVSFASEARTLLKIPGLKNSLDPASLARFLCLNYIPGTNTLAREVKRLPPASWRLYQKNGEKKSGSYWKPEESKEISNFKMPEAIEEFRGIFDRSVALSLRSDVPVGIFLSGGIDSSLILESAARQGKLNHAFCLDFREEGFSEVKQAEFAAQKMGVTFSAIPFDAGIFENFSEILRHSSDPMADSSILPLWALSKAAGTSHKVVLGGDGGDEMFGGYLTYKASLLQERVGSHLPFFIRSALGQAADFLPVSENKVSTSFKLYRFLRALTLPARESHFTWNGSWMASAARNLCRSEEIREELLHVMHDLADELAIPNQASLRDLQLADLGGYLPDDILTKSDRMGMAHGLEIRSPFLNHDLANFALSLAPSLRLSPTGVTKALLRERARAIYGSPLANAPKQGFSIPIHRWLREPAKDLMEHWLSTERLQNMPFLEAPLIRKMVDSHMQKKRSLGFELWGLMVLSFWHKEYLE